MRLLLCVASIVICQSIYAQQSFTSGGKLRPEQAIMDIRHYTIALDVDPASKGIEGYTLIEFILLQPTRVLLFDLLDSFHISTVLVNHRSLPFEYHNNLIAIHLPVDLPAGRASVQVNYSGKPHVARRPPWDDGFIWTHDSTGHPWVAVTAEGTGGKLYFPCKDHPSEEPNEGAELRITVPEGLVVAGPGLLQRVSHKKGKVTYDWKTNYTINNYSLVFNVARYRVVSREYTTVLGNKVPMQFYVLEEDSAKAGHHLDVLEQTVRSREKYFGEYPWAKEKIGIAETPHLGMEHQTMNAYGNQFRYKKIGGQDFDWLMDHEFGHEWWGNKITVKDWADYWIHEGINSFGDALDIRELEGENGYIRHFQEMAPHFKNKIPLVFGKDLDEESAYQGDIYGKGAFFMHTLRFVMGDPLFFSILKSFATSPGFTYDNLVTTADVESYFCDSSSMDLHPLFNLYLKTTSKLEIAVTKLSQEDYRISLMNLDMTLPLEITTSQGTQRFLVDKKGILLKSSSLPLIDPNTYYLTKISLE